jgi:hypothetical protein
LLDWNALSDPFWQLGEDSAGGRWLARDQHKLWDVEYYQPGTPMTVSN